MHVTRLVLGRYPAGMPDFQSSAELTPEIPGASIDPASSTVAELRQAMAESRLTATALTQHYLDRIAEVNPALRAVIAVLPDALEQAAASDAAWQQAGPAAPLRASRSWSKTTSRWPARRPRRARPRCSGPSRPTRSSSPGCARRARSSWPRPTCRSGRTSAPPGRAAAGRRVGGQTANPYALDRNPSGSSSGSAAGSRPGFAPLAVGTETDGSIVSPSSACGVVGIKPTLGLVSRTGIVPLSLAQDTAGPMASSVADAAVLLSAMAAADPATLRPGHRGRRPPRRSRLHRLRRVPRPGGARGRADRHLAGRLGRRRRRHRGAARRGGGLPARARRGGDRPGRPARHRQGHRARVRRAELRVQARDQRLPQVPGRVHGRRRPGAAGHAGRADRVQRAERRAGARPVRPGDLPGGEATTGDLADPVYLELRGPPSGWRCPRSRRRWSSTSSTRSSR